MCVKGLNEKASLRKGLLMDSQVCCMDQNCKQQMANEAGINNVKLAQWFSHFHSLPISL